MDHSEISEETSLHSLPPLRFTHRPRHDEKLPDGFVRSGWRKVRKGGIVTFQSDRWQDDALLPYLGAFVFCEINDMWALTINIFPEGWSFAKCRSGDFIKPKTYKEPA